MLPRNHISCVMLISVYSNFDDTETSMSAALAKVATRADTVTLPRAPLPRGPRRAGRRPQPRCERCNAISPDGRCPRCGSRKIR